MARWIPPIPKAAMYRQDTIRLGEALPLLFYCYDCVDRAGWVDLKLSDASDVLGIPYPTIKHWWQSIEKTTIFDEVVRRGRSGLRLHFAPDWIDWSMPDGWQRPDETGSLVVPKEKEQSVNGRETGSLVVPIVENEPVNGIVIGRQTGSSSIPNFLHIGTHDSRSNNDDMRADDLRNEAALNDQHQPSSSPVASREETKQTHAPVETKALPIGESFAPPTPVPPPPSSPRDAYALLWADSGPDEQAWLKRAIPYDSERRRLSALVERHGLAFVAEGVMACVQQSGRTIAYLEKMCAACAERGTTPSQPRSASMRGDPAPKRDPVPENETEEERRRREYLVAERIRATSGKISYHGGTSRHGPLTA